MLYCIKQCSYHHIIPGRFFQPAHILLIVRKFASSLNVSFAAHEGNSSRACKASLRCLAASSLASSSTPDPLMNSTASLTALLGESLTPHTERRSSCSFFPADLNAMTIGSVLFPCLISPPTGLPVISGSPTTPSTSSTI